jgi:guanylate kinase
MSNEPSVHSQLLDQVRNYKMPQTAQDLIVRHPPLVIAGITASGKNSVVRYITETTDYRQVITHTTRQPRTDETNGRDYFFVSDEQMLQLLNNKAMIEAKNVHGNAVYGVSIRAYQDVVFAGHKPLLIVDVKGVEELTKYLPKLRPVFLLPPSFERWVEMLEDRGRMSHLERLRRMHSARSELLEVMTKERFFLVVNYDVPNTAREILKDIHDPSSQRKAREVAHLLIDRLKTL